MSFPIAFDNRNAANALLEGDNGYGMLRDGSILIGATGGRLLAGEIMASTRRARSQLPSEAGGRTLVR